jgi:Integrase core domain/Chromo (CHRromatin Organisation MOdifier) domain
MGKKKANKILWLSYYSPQRPGAYGGVPGLQRSTKIKPSTVKDWLSHQDTYTLHKPVRHRFPRRRTIVGGLDHQFQADLIDVKNIKKYNDGYVFLLTCIDVLSKYAWVIPLKTKTGEALVAAFRSIFAQGRKPLRLQTDKGTEFINKTFQKFLKEEGVYFFVTENEDIKASIVERFNRTLKEKMWRYFTKKNTLRYVEVLPALVRNYNHSYHRSIQRTPAEVDETNQEEVWQTLYGDSGGDSGVFREGDRVRISKARRTFKKGYLPSWTEELFTVSRLNRTTPVTYVLNDDHGEELKGTFYKEEIQKVGDKRVYRVESILDEREDARGRKEYLVKWFGYDSSFNSWIAKEQLTRYHG